MTGGEAAHRSGSRRSHGAAVDAQGARSFPERLLTVEEALDLILEAAGSPLPPEEIPLVEGLGRVVAEPLVSLLDLPPWDNSAMDGYAVRAADVADATRGAPVRLRVAGEVRAGGSTDVVVPQGGAVRIATGAPLPEGADSVVPVELTVDESGEPMRALHGDQPLPGECLVAEAIPAGNAVRRRGEDVRAGAIVIEEGTRLRPAHLGLAGAVGAGAIRVHRRPVAGVLSTGDELRFPGQPLGPSGVPDANRPGLLTCCREAGVWAVDLGIASDNLDAVLGALRPAIERSDAILVTGGVSVGPYDVVRAAFAELGSVELWRVAVQPGKPFAFGLSEPRATDGRRVLLFGLPGNPVSAFVTFELFVRPALDTLSGLTGGRDRPDRGVLEDAVSTARGRRAFVRVAAVRDEHGVPVRDAAGRVRVRSSGGQGSHILSAMAAADALAIVPEEIERAEAGTEVELRWLAG